MPEDEQNSDQQVAQQLYEFVANEMRSGADKATIARKLEDKGVSRRDAEQIAGTAYDEISAMVRKEQFTGSALVPGIVGGLLGAAVGGAVWAGIAVATDYELGIIAWGIGGLCGFGVVLLSSGRKGVPLQVVAVATSVLGILVGKYGIFCYYLRDALLQEYGEDGLTDFSVFSPNVVQYFVASLPEIVGVYDALWVLLAVITAWRIPAASGIVLRSSMPRGPIRPA